MINLVEITTACREQMETIRLNSGVQTSAMSFNMAYIWCELFQHKLWMTDEAYILKYGICGPNAWLMPVGTDDGKRELIEGLLEQGTPEFYMVSEEDMAFLNQYFPGTFTFEECPDDSDYVYDVQEQCERSGKKFAGMRRIWNKYARKHQVTSEPLSEENMQIAYDIIAAWREGKSPRGSAGIVGDESDYLVLQEFEELNYEGLLVSLDGEPTSVIIGYELTPDTFDGVVAKVRGNHDGFSYITKYLLLLSLKDRYQYFNAEPDLGIAGLKMNKQNMNPCRMNRLWKASIT